MVGGNGFSLPLGVIPILPTLGAFAGFIPWVLFSGLILVASLRKTRAARATGNFLWLWRWPVAVVLGAVAVALALAAPVVAVEGLAWVLLGSAAGVPSPLRSPCPAAPSVSPRTHSALLLQAFG